VLTHPRVAESRYRAVAARWKSPGFMMAGSVRGARPGPAPGVRPVFGRRPPPLLPSAAPPQTDPFPPRLRGKGSVPSPIPVPGKEKSLRRRLLDEVEGRGRGPTPALSVFFFSPPMHPTRPRLPVRVSRSLPCSSCFRARPCIGHEMLTRPRAMVSTRPRGVPRDVPCHAPRAFAHGLVLVMKLPAAGTRRRLGGPVDQ
jgi:hypothetical protein